MGLAGRIAGRGPGLTAPLGGGLKVIFNFFLLTRVNKNINQL